LIQLVFSLPDFDVMIKTNQSGIVVSVCEVSMFSLQGWPVLCHALSYAEGQSWMGSERQGLRHSPGPSAHSSLL